MTLPELGDQMVWARLAWGVVAAAILLSLLPVRGMKARGAAVLLAFVAMWLPGPASAAWWLGLAFQQPSALFAALCGVSVWKRFALRPDQQTLPLALAAALVAGGLVLYADAVGALSLGLYPGGFEAPRAPVAGVVLSVLALAVIVRGRQAAAGWAVLLALTFHAVTRLPTGNLFDALLDPLLWLWALARCVALAFAVVSARRRGRAAGAPTS
ncbi:MULTISPECIES: hypothetical protein [unclassified Rhizobacter]|uniref:hypothetical protein n=1 Tax=unclassified Rhizobacter TaxID=2640088 RepID=UPI0006F57D17|nr:MULTISPECIES: hypothetical protein [unclassified Rhizobacter]KQU81383.1 hypothetical protein ASC88_00395 [Rhizobacter sp. Root29]KQW14651.1 hypothetical protein ASC98_16050 [Rhizobacter sp. Root1238]KRB24006.1 hypothetical protein ASE08_20230 [Rhizobacter sp. Root16D2]